MVGRAQGGQQVPDPGVDVCGDLLEGGVGRVVGGAGSDRVGDAPVRTAWVVGELDTVVKFALAPTATGTRLSIVHSGFKTDQKRNFSGARYGWRMMSGKLVDLLARNS